VSPAPAGARPSAFAFKGKNEDVAHIGQKLHVTHILEGSVRKAGDQIRITDVFAVHNERGGARSLPQGALPPPTSGTRERSAPWGKRAEALGMESLSK